MRDGFSLVELLVALLVFQVGILALAGTVLLAQHNMTRAELRLRAAVEAGWIGDSVLGGEGTSGAGSGHTAFLWGEVDWTSADLGLGGLRLVASRRGREDTLAVVYLWPPLRDSLLPGPSGGSGRDP